MKADPPCIELKDLLELPELTTSVVTELGSRWDGVVSGKVAHEGKVLNFCWISDDDLKDDIKEGRDYVVYDDSKRIYGRITEQLVNSFRATEGNYLLWELKATP